MKVDTWVWNWGDYPGADNDDAHLPIREVCLKTHEASVWFTQGQLTDLARIYREQGIVLSAWSVPLGYVDDVANNVAVLNMLRSAGIERPYLQLDFELEPTPNFWKGTPAQVHDIFRRTKAACPWAELGMCLYQFEERLGFITALGLPECDRAVTMSYWTDFGTTPEARLSFEYVRLAPYGKPVQFGLPGNSDPARMTRGLQWIKDQAPLAIPPIVWRRGTTSRATWDSIAAFEMAPPKPPPPPPPPPPPERRPVYAEATQWQVDDAVGADQRAARFAEITQELGGWFVDDKVGAIQRGERLVELEHDDGV